MTHAAFRFASGIAAAAILALCCVTAARAEDAVCATLYNAMLKMAQTPNHQYTETTAPDGKKSTGELISTSDEVYLRIHAEWHKSRMTPKDYVALERENIKNASGRSCKYLRDETIDGQAAAVYSAHEKSDSGTSDSQVWIAKRSGLPLKTSVDISAGEGKGMTSHMTSRSDYTNVQAPPGAK